jgi:serine/threonine protein phosphatase 1
MNQQSPIITGATASELASAAAAVESGKPISLIKRIPIEPGRRYFVVGDLHGCYDMLMALLETADVNLARDIVICTGDLGDRGPDSAKCIGLIKEKWFESVAGNHEEMLMGAVTAPNFDWQWWSANGGTWATMVTEEGLAELAALVSTLPLAIVVGEGEQRFNVIHGEFYGSDAALEDVLENIRPDSPVPLSLTWGRDMLKGVIDPAVQENLSLTFCGHNIVEQVGKIGNQVYIDTGAFIAARRTEPSPYGLTMVEPLTGNYWRHSPHGAVKAEPAVEDLVKA